MDSQRQVIKTFQPKSADLRLPPFSTRPCYVTWASIAPNPCTPPPSKAGQWFLHIPEWHTSRFPVTAPSPVIQDHSAHVARNHTEALFLRKRLTHHNPACQIFSLCANNIHLIIDSEVAIDMFTTVFSGWYPASTWWIYSWNLAASFLGSKTK